MEVLNKDIVVVGAGLLGSSVAMHLSMNGANEGNRSIAVVDLDLEGTFSSSELNAGGVRATWNNPVNAAISKISIDYYAKCRDEVGFRQRGYFWMFSKENWPQASAALRANESLRELGVEYLSPREVTDRHPFIDKVEDLGGATFSPRDGLLNPNLLKLHYRQEAKKRGVTFIDRVWVNRVDMPKSGQIELEASIFPSNVEPEKIREVLSDPTRSWSGVDRRTIRTGVLVNCSGAWARRFAECMGTSCPSQPMRRQVSIFECRDVSLERDGMFVDSSGVYFHAEAGNILAGFATPEEIPGYNFNYDGEKFFEEFIWPPLYNRSSKFENLKHVTGWAGLYEVSPDKSAIVGAVPGFKNVYEAHSFSGRGAMQSYGAGLGLAELIQHGKFQSLELSGLSGARFSSGQLLSEGMLI